MEPTGLGTPRGAPAGFSRRTLSAVLFALASADVKQTAQELGVCYGAVTKWRTEAAFLPRALKAGSSAERGSRRATRGPRSRAA